MIRFIICMGVGFSPGDTHWMPTLGFGQGSNVVRKTAALESSKLTLSGGLAITIG